ncbi:AAA family ATPase [Amycolatopsis japonica]|uniref:ATP-binding protein n=1 Tax=Amycolatopsis japonica TaxID=208439 RepID=UPI0033D57D87
MGSFDVVGRDSELSRLDRACKASRRGQGAAICLTGPAGIGKTALLRTAERQARRLEVVTASTWCWEEGAPPLWPWLDLLAQLEILPDTSDLAVQGIRAFRLVEQAVAAAASRTPLFIAIDDLHNADEATMLLTRYMAARVPASPAVLVVTHRPADQALEPGRDSRLLTEIDRACDVMTLPTLSPNSMAELVSARSQRDLPPNVIDALTAATGGIPLHAVAALDVWASDTAEPDLTVELQTIVQSRLRGLGADDAAIVARAAVLGRMADTDMIAIVCGTTPARVNAAICAAQSNNLARSSRPNTIDFSHDLVRDAVLGWLTPDDVAATHSAAATLYMTGSITGGTDVVRAARHGLRAARRSPSDAERTVDLGRNAADVLARGGAPEDAASLLEQTIVANDLAGRPVSHARLLLELASVVLLTGRLSAAQDRYSDATTTALAEKDPVVVAEAAAGLGALWVNTVRSPVAQQWVIRTQRAALAHLPDGHESVRLRLRARIAGEAMFWERADAEELIDVVNEVLTADDAATILEVLSVAHNPLLGPQHTALRMRLSEEMLTKAAAVPGGILSLMALCWRTVDLFLAGDRRAERALADLREAAEAFQSLSVLYVVRVIETMLMICRGQFTQAERAAQSAFELGTRAQDADALSYLGGQLVAIRWFQGREPEMLDLMESIATSPQVDVVDRSFEAAVAALAARAGQPDSARRHLSRVEGSGLRSLPQFSTWLVTLATIVETAVALDDQPLLAEAYELLSPYGDLPVAPSLAVVSFGCAHYWLGTAAHATGRPELAERHLRAAVDTNLRHGHLPATAVSRAELARVLTVHRPNPEREVEARQLLAAALHVAMDAGMEVLAERWGDTANRLDRSDRIQLTRDETTGYGGWFVDFAGHRATVRDLTGIRMLAVLIASPEQWIPASQLVFGQMAPPHAAPPALLDVVARRTLESRARELGSIVARAREAGDLTTQTAAEDELDAIAGHLSAASGLAGHSRSFIDENERARTSVRKAIVRALHEIERQHPAAATYLRNHLATGAECRYRSTVREAPKA